jgi:hypothetical protein
VGTSLEFSKREHEYRDTNRYQGFDLQQEPPQTPASFEVCVNREYQNANYLHVNPTDMLLNPYDLRPPDPVTTPLAGQPTNMSSSSDALIKPRRYLPLYPS